MLQEITYSLTALNTTKELVKAALGVIKDSVARDAINALNSQIFSITEHLLTTQIKYQELIDIKKELEQKLLNYENWDADAPNYELLEVSYGVRVYSEKSQQQSIYERVWLCPNCFDSKLKRILQLQSRKSPMEYVCHHCKSSFMVRQKQEV